MSKASVARDESEVPEGTEAGSQDVYANAGKAFQLIEKYQTPPDPGTYSLWYAFVSGRDEQLVAQVEDLLATKGSLSKFEIDSLCQEQLAKDSNEVTRQNIGLAMREEISGVMKIVQESLKNSQNFNTKLNDVGSKLPNAVPGSDLAAVLSGLIEENQRMAVTTKELHQGLEESQKQIESLNKELEEVQNQSMRDPLTSVYNRRAFDIRLADEIRKAEATGKNLCLAMADIDHFKRVNDTYGHQTGDAVLKVFASIVVNNVKGQDMVARIGGEEFAIILPDTDVVPAYNLLVKIKHSFKSAELVCGRGGDTISGLTASFGVAQIQAGMNARELIEQADSYLYHAKNEGRDKVRAKGF